MAGVLKNPLKFVLILMFVMVGVASADIKVRVYLKDGSLQAGNLVTETDKALVILSAKSGREEIPKDKIMFVNGKPLAYWESHPEKNYQTEIIPSEIPQPGYVTNKAALPPAPALPKLDTVLPPKPPQAVRPTPTPAPPVVEKSVVAAEAPKPSPTAMPKQKPVVAETVKPVEPKPLPVVEKPAPEAKPEVASVPVVKKVARRKKHVEETPAQAAAVPVSPVGPPRPKKFIREDMARYHSERALIYLQRGEKGRAITELQFSTMLDRRDADGSLLLGRLLAEEGVNERAEKALSNPGLRKNKEALKLLSEMEDSAKKAKKEKNTWIGISCAGLLLALVSPWIVRKLSFKKKINTVTLSADQLDSPIPEQLRAVRDKVEVADEEPKPMEPPTPIVIPEKPIVTAQPPVEIPSPAFFEKKLEEIKPKPEIKIPEIKIPEIKPPEMAPPAPVASVPTPSFETPRKSIDELIRSREEFLSTSKSVDEIVARGHEAAAAGKTDQAQKEYRTALALHPQSIEAVLGLAYVAFMQQSWERALEYYLLAAQINPKSADVHYGIGRVFLETQHETEAIEEFRLALQLDPTYFEARETLTALGATV